MNIKEAKEYIKNSINIYLKKDEFGDYRIPVIRQRPVFMVGAPGIGKTAIMEQIAQELQIALVSYSMTHHTRQSALGLPLIKHKEYEGMEYDVSDYTMSEIIASIYETMEKTGVKEGILFLDEINCVSETLAPAMLLFLQYKIFGRHKVPEGWVIVTAGNPPEYNKSVREFDVVTLDRLKVINVEPDFSVWKEYAVKNGVTPSVLNFLQLKNQYFYHMETRVEGRSYITARGWEDLSEMLKMYEEDKLPVTKELIGQYIRNDRIAGEFSAYYDLYNKYKSDYNINNILEGQSTDDIIIRAKAAGFDERLSLMGMLVDRVQADMKEVLLKYDYLGELVQVIKAMKALTEEKTFNIQEYLNNQIVRREERLIREEQANMLSYETKRKQKHIVAFLKEAGKNISASRETDCEDKFLLVKSLYDDRVKAMKERAKEVAGELTLLFNFVNSAFGEENEMLILVTELTAHEASLRFTGLFGCEEYFKYSERLMVSERHDNIRQRIKELGI